MSSCPEYESFAEFYDHVVPYRSRPDVGFFVEMARAAQGPVLEVGCGTGRVLLPCARAGVPITGLDVSRAMLDVLGQQLAREPADVQARVQIVEGDMRDFDLGQRFALVMLPFRSFQHVLTQKDQRATLRRLRAHVADGGRLILDLFNPSIPFLGDERWSIHPVREPEFTMPDGRTILRSYRIAGRDFFNQIQIVEFLIDVTHPDGREEHRTEQFELRYLFRYEAEYLLECEGFETEALYGDYDRSPYGQNYPGDLIFVAKVGGTGPRTRS